jgi:hypothetical protein
MGIRCELCERIVTDTRMLIRLSQPALFHGWDVFLSARPSESLARLIFLRWG